MKNHKISSPKKIINLIRKNSNLILLPNSPQAGSDMLNNMVASFTASNQIGEAMKNTPIRKKEKDNDENGF